eukprot:gene5922-7124_t
MANVSQSDDWSLDSDLMLYRQRHAEGNQEMEAMILKHFQTTPTFPRANCYWQPNAHRAEGEDDLTWSQRLYDAMICGHDGGGGPLYNTQYITGKESIVEVDAARLCRNVCMFHGPTFMCGCTDAYKKTAVGVCRNWEAPTWSSIEYGGKWKVLHYVLRHVFSPRLLMARTEGDTLEVHANNDLPQETRADVNLQLWRWDADSQSAPSYLMYLDLQFAPLANVQVWNSSLTDILSQSACGLADCFLLLEYTVLGEESHVSTLFFAPPVEINLPQVYIMLVAASMENPKQALLQFTSTAVAAYAWIEADCVPVR